MTTGKDGEGSKILSPGGARIVLFWKVVEYCGLLGFLLLVPPGMGAERYGEFAVFLSLLYLFWMGSSLGGQAAFARFIPEYRNSGATGMINGMFMQFFLLRLLLAVLVSMGFVAVLSSLLPDLTVKELALAAGVYMAGLSASTFYQLQFGLNNVGRWLCQDSSRRVLLIFMLTVFGLDYAFESIVKLMLFIEVFFFTTGAYWARSSFHMDRTLGDLSRLIRYLKYGIAFFLGNLLLMIFWRSGDIVILKLSSLAEEVAYFSVANAVVMALYGLFSQLSILIVPSLMSLKVQDEHDRKILWLGNTLKYVTAIVFVVILVAWSVAEPLLANLLGESFRPVATNLLILLFSLLPMNIIRLGMSSSLVHDRPEYNAWVAGTALLAFLVSALVLTPLYGSNGAAVAVVIGAGVGGMLAYRVFSMQKILIESRFAALVLIGTACMLLVVWAPLPPLLLSACVPVLFVVALFLLRVFHLDEVLWALKRQHRPAVEENRP